MGSGNNFKVVIAGGSIAGLALANILERVGIDFVVLESYPDIAPQVGASIGVTPNGLRVLDQVGAYPAVRALIDRPICKNYIRAPGGILLNRYDNVFDHLEKRHGYPIVFVDRQMILKVLYDNLKDKSKVKTSKKVVEVKVHSHKAEVLTADGDHYSGDIVVGADGIHSMVRREIWRISGALEPGYIAESDQEPAMSCKYICIFGISTMKDFESHSTTIVVNDNFSYLVISGPGGRVYWFLDVSLGKTRYGKDIPRCTKEDEAKLAKEHWDDRINDTTTFGDLYNHKETSTLTALTECVFKTWHYKRVVTIGDASHKYNPLTGQGGNSAIEDAACLVNELQRRMKSDSQKLSDSDVEEAFATLRDIRTPRLWKLLNASHDLQSVEGLENPLLRFVAQYVFPRTTKETQIDLWSAPVVGGVSVESLEIPKKFRLVPFDDELPAKPLGSPWLGRGVMATVLLGLFYTAQKSLFLSSEGMPRLFHGGPLIEVYTGYEAIDSIFSNLVLGFAGVVRSDAATTIQYGYFLVSLIAATFSWTVEGYRAGVNHSPTLLPVVYLMAAQLVGIGKIAPLYFVLVLLTNASGILQRASGRPIPVSVAKALPPALFVGFIIPTALMFLPFEDPALSQSFIALWQPFPLYVAALTTVFASMIDSVAKSPHTEMEMYEQRDVAPLQSGYALVFFTTAVVHICSVLYVWASPSLSATVVFWGIANSGILETFWHNDMLLYFASITAWSLYSIYDLRRSGYIQTRQALGAAAAAVAGQVLVGPGAVYTGVSGWRETVISQLVVNGN